MRRYIVKALYRFAFSSGAKIIFQNDDDFRYFVEKSIIKKEQGRIIHGSGVNLQEFLPAEEPPLPVKILFSGRLLWNKGLGDLVVAAKHLRQKGLSFELYVAGELIPQNPGGISLSQIKEWERDGIIKNLGYRKDMPNLLQQVHIVCLPSFYGEGVPRALIEAAASGKAIVTTDAPGCRSIVKDGVNGFLVPPKDIERLSEALAALILDPVRRINFGVNGRNRVAKEGFSEEDVLKETFAIYEEILSRGTERLTAFNAN
jgi:glycosyltransferase involved in cell wall biosynthesis